MAHSEVKKVMTSFEQECLEMTISEFFRDNRDESVRTVYTQAVKATLHAMRIADYESIVTHAASLACKVIARMSE